MKTDIQHQDDIKLLVDTFYSKVNNDAILSPIFNTAFQVDWEHHLPRMYSFWEFMLFQTGTYRGAPFDVHLAVNEKVHLTEAHFDCWLALFNGTIEELFEGSNAAMAKLKVENIKKIWSYKMQQINSAKN